MNYFKLLFFYLITFIDAMINFVCALFHFYPSLEMAQDFLVARELERIGGEISHRNEAREAALERADTLMEQAKNFEEEV